MPERAPRPSFGFSRLLPTVLVTLVFVVPLQAQVRINEFAPKGTEWVELHNAGGAMVDLTGWYLDDADCGVGSSTISSSIGAGGFFVVSANDGGDNFSLDNSGDRVVLCDNSGTEIDRVTFGDTGAAPIGPSPSGGDQHSTARTSDGGDTDDDAADWNMDPTPTQGTANDVAGTNLGGSIIINEVDLFPASGNDYVGLFNPTGSPISVVGWAISDGDDFCTLNVGIPDIPAGGIRVIEETVHWTSNGSTGCDFGSTDVAYLLTDTGVRVDQLAWGGEVIDNCAMRSPNGAGPNDGFNWTTSGGGVTLFDACTPLPVKLQSFSID